MESLEQALSRSLDLALQGKLVEAQAALADRTETPALQLAAFLKLRVTSMASARHEMGNALSIARSSIEAMLDGIVETTEPRLNRLREILAGVSEAMYVLTADAAGSAHPQNAEVAALAEAKQVRLICEPGTDSPPAQRVLMTAIRYTAPGAEIRVALNGPQELTMKLPSPAAAEVLHASAGAARIVHDDGSQATLHIRIVL